ncbi:MAG TPA: heme-binding domain-containing protein [Candidatus Polarisedimenticolia bacterium]|nr:heme-binding domain-containing protein [Candidatus Polarisedimenticolia bacterium]
MKLLKGAGIVLAVAFAGIQFVRPDRSNPPEDPAATLGAVAPMSPAAREVFDRSCADCHSSRTRWPWYSHVAPVSWFVAEHVRHARSHLNVSEFARYEPDDAAHHVKEMCEMAEEGRMPLPSYLWIHRGARLGQADVRALCDWSEGARRALQRDGSRSDGQAGETGGKEASAAGEGQHGHRHDDGEPHRESGDGTPPR